jgi:hypothetical protein
MGCGVALESSGDLRAMCSEDRWSHWLVLPLIAADGPMKQFGFDDNLCQTESSDDMPMKVIRGRPASLREGFARAAWPRGFGGEFRL